MKPNGNTIVITGGTAGIGRGLAIAFYKGGNSVIVAGRNRAAMDELVSAHPGMAAMELDIAAAEATIATNLLGPIRLTAALLPQLSGRPDAAIINVSSTQAFVPLPFSPSYCATKAALHAWTFGLRLQLQSAGIEVIEIIPPAVQTELTPGQSQSPFAMPLDAFLAETMELLRMQPTPGEICVEQAKPWRAVTDDHAIASICRQFGLPV